MWTQNHQSGRQTGGASAVSDPGERPGGPAPPPSFLDQNEARKAEQKKIFFEAAPPPRLSQGLDYRLPLIRRSVFAIVVPPLIHCAESRIG